RAARRVEVGLALRDRGVEQECRWLDWETFGGELQRALRGVDVAILESGLAGDVQRLARRARVGRNRLQRLARLAQLDAIVARSRALEPDGAERLVEQRIARALQRRAEREDRAVEVPGARVGEADRGMARDAIAIDVGEPPQLIDLFGAPVQRA